MSPLKSWMKKGTIGIELSISWYILCTYIHAFLAWCFDKSPSCLVFKRQGKGNLDYCIFLTFLSYFCPSLLHSSHPSLPPNSIQYCFHLFIFFKGVKGQRHHHFLQERHSHLSNHKTLAGVTNQTRLDHLHVSQI